MWIFEFAVKIGVKPVVWAPTSTILAQTLFSSPTLCLDSISDVGLVITFLPTERKNFLRTQKWKLGFWGFLKIPGIYVFSDSRFGIYTKSYVNTNILDMISTFWRKVQSRARFASKTGFCSSRTAQRTLDRTDPRFGKFMFESTCG